MKSIFILGALVALTVSPVFANPPATQSELRYHYFAGLADKEVFLQAEMKGEIRAADAEIEASKEAVAFEERLIKKGFGSSIRVHYATNRLNLAEYAKVISEKRFEQSKRQQELYSLQMNAAQGKPVEVAKLQELNQTLLKLSCRIARYEVSAFRSDLSYAQAYLLYKQHKSPETQTKIDQLKAKIAAKQDLLALCQKQFGL